MFPALITTSGSAKNAPGPTMEIVARVIVTDFWKLHPMGDGCAMHV
ncbi:hypothetical protein [Rhodoferax sp.]|nr:hypothetical protein [Rhodoferax sp.]